MGRQAVGFLTLYTSGSPYIWVGVLLAGSVHANFSWGILYRYSLPKSQSPLEGGVCMRFNVVLCYVVRKTFYSTVADGFI